MHFECANEIQNLFSFAHLHIRNAHINNSHISIMQNPRLATRYAKSLIELASEQKQLEAVHNDMQYIQALCKASRDFTNVLRSPIIKPDKKQAIVNAVIDNNISTLTKAFITLIIKKSREYFLPEITAAFVEQYNTFKNIHAIKLTTAVAISEAVKQNIQQKIQQETALQNIQIEEAVEEELIGGFMLEFNNNLLDVSILRDLKDVQKQFNENLYVPNIR